MDDHVKNKHAMVLKQSVLECCLRPLLDVLGWKGTERQFKEALPHYTEIYSVPMFCQVMGYLNYSRNDFKLRLDELDPRTLPCLFVSDSGNVMVLKSINGDEIEIFNGEMNADATLSRSNPDDMDMVGRAYVFKIQDKDDKAAEVKIGWIRKTYLQNRGLIFSALAISFVLNLLALATPLFVMAVYNRVIGASSMSMLWQFGVGILIAMIAVAFLYRTRARLLAIIGARFDREIGDRIFERLLYLAPIYTESATVGAQVSRIKDFDRLREFLSGPLLTVFFELPFIFVSLAIIAIVAGNLVIIPTILIIVFVTLGLTLAPEVRRRIRASSSIGSRAQEFLLESIRGMRALKYTASETTWIRRHRKISANSAYSSLKVSLLAGMNSAISDALMVMSGLCVISFGAVKIINGTLSVGGMLATMILVWRLLAPLKVIFNTFPRLQQLRNSVVQITRLMSIAPESSAKELLHRYTHKFKGDLSFYRVSLRYQSAFDPALVGVEFKVPAGELVAIVGRNGSGKSTILKVILGLYQPQAGSVRIDDRDIRQLNPIELRNSIAYLPQMPELFYGSIGANLRLAKPGATDEELRKACDKAGILNDILSLPEGFDSQIRDFSTTKLASSFQQMLCLARAFLKEASIILLDEPANMLDYESDQNLLKILSEMRGKTTVMMVTHRPSHLKQMDRILLMEQGQLVLQGPPDEVLPKIPKGML